MFYYSAMKQLYQNTRDHHFSLVSGGMPNSIPSLSYEEFRAFHLLNYHPSKAKIFVYGILRFVVLLGDMELDSVLESLEPYLTGSDSIPISHTIDNTYTQEYKYNNQVIISGPVDDPSKNILYDIRIKFRRTESSSNVILIKNRKGNHNHKIFIRLIGMSICHFLYFQCCFPMAQLHLFIEI